jgi:hypothetical protein
MHTPFDDEIEAIAKDKGLSIDDARDRFILDGLRCGDTDPLMCFLLSGYVPGLWVRKWLGVMLAPEKVLSESDILKQELQFRFNIQSRNGKRGPVKRKFKIARRNDQLAAAVRSIIEKHGRGFYDAAIKTVALDTGLNEQTVRDAYDETRRGKRSAK